MHNPNPAEIALDECAHVWPSNPRRDLILSLGTGIGPAVASPVGPSTGEFAEGVLLRIARWSRSRLAKVLDPQDVHRRVRHTLRRHDPAACDRYFRLNLDWPSPLPRIDDVTCMVPLMAAAAERRDDPIFRRIKLAIIASSFFFELDGPSTPANDSGKWCRGAIRIRRDPTRVLDLLPTGHTSRLRFTKDDDDLAIGRACDWLCPTCGRFNLPVRFPVSSTMDPISIALRLGPGHRHHISGFPQNLQWFIEQQRLHDPFVAPSSPPTECACRLKVKPRAIVGAGKRAASQMVRAPSGKRRRRA